MRSRSKNPPSRPPPQQLPDQHQRSLLSLSQRDDQFDYPSSTNTSALTSRHASNASIWSLGLDRYSRRSTPPTPIGSPSLFRPPSQTPSVGNLQEQAHHHLHPSQYRQMDRPARETHNANLTIDPRSGTKQINNYRIIDEIGRGTHGKVKLGYDMTLGTADSGLVAIKIVDRTPARPRLGRKNDDNSELKIRREIAILKKIQHPNVVGLLEVIDDVRSKKVYLVLEYVVLGEVQWRKRGDSGVIIREMKRLRRELKAIKSAKNAKKLAEVGAPKMEKSGSQLSMPARPGNVAPDAKEEQVEPAKTGDEAQAKTKTAKKKRRKTPNRRTRYWSLEFASSSEEEEEIMYSHKNGKIMRVDDDGSDTDPSFTVSDEDNYIPSLTIEESRLSFRDTVVGLEHLHWNGVIHRDIKPANLLWTKDKGTKISDFGVSFLGRPKAAAEGEEDSPVEEEPTGLEQDELELAKTAGTPAFFAPELCTTDFSKPKPRITNAIDVWALGVTLYCFIYGRLPFNADIDWMLFESIANEEPHLPPRRLRPVKDETTIDLPQGRLLTSEELEEYETEYVDPEVRDLLKRLLTKDPEDRITLKEVKRHPWVLTGLPDPFGWIERTDPEAKVKKIEISNEDVETAVSISGVIGRAKSAIKKSGTWFRGLRRRASSTANGSNTDLRSDGGLSVDSDREQSSNAEDRELQWMGGMPSRLEENTLAPIQSHSSAGSAETAFYGHQQTFSDDHSVITVVSGSPKRSGVDRMLRRKHPMALRPSRDSLRRSVRGPSLTAPTSPVNEFSHKASCVTGLAEPHVERRVPHEEAAGLRARNLLNTALRASPSASPSVSPAPSPRSSTNGSLRRDVETYPLKFDHSPNPQIQAKQARHRREELEVARSRLPSENMDPDKRNRVEQWGATTPPIPMYPHATQGSGSYFTDSSRTEVPPFSSSGEPSATAISSLSNSTSFPTALTQPSSFGSDLVSYASPSRRGSTMDDIFAMPVDEQAEDADDSSWSSDESDGGLVMKDIRAAPKPVLLARSSTDDTVRGLGRSHSVMVGEVARMPQEEKEERLKAGGGVSGLRSAKRLVVSTDERGRGRRKEGEH